MEASIKADPTFEAEVITRRAGNAEPLKFIGIFKHRTRDQLSELVNGSRDNPKSDVDSVMEILVGWKGIKEEFSRENVTALTQNFHYSAGDIADTYIAQLGVARSGN